MRRGWVIAVALLAGGCATVPTTPATVPHVGESPALNTVVGRSVGDTIYESYDYSQLTGARLKDQARGDALAIHWNIPAGEFLTAFSDSTETKVYCTTEPILHIPFSRNSSRICLADRDSDGSFDHWTAPEGPSDSRLHAWNTMDKPIAFSGAQGSSMRAGGEGFRNELVYEGISGSVVAILYREFVNDLARPAFQQDLHYTLQDPGPTEVSFRGARLRIHSADNNTIRYEILSGLRK
jgi:hypothetical protein